jgi:hydrogenase-4 component E
MTLPLVDTAFVLLILTNFFLLGASRLNSCIRIGAVQGIMVGLMPIVVEGAGITVRIAAIGAVIIVLKGAVFPYLLSRAIRESNTSREVQPYVGYVASLFYGVFALLGAFLLDSRLQLPIHATSTLIVPLAFSMMLTGFFLIVARRNAVNQVIGYLVLENGIYSFGLAISKDIPVLIELGVLMDMFVAVFVMGIAIFRINREFDHIDAARLDSLKG